MVMLNITLAKIVSNFDMVQKVCNARRGSSLFIHIRPCSSDSPPLPQKWFDHVRPMSPSPIRYGSIIIRKHRFAGLKGLYKPLANLLVIRRFFFHRYLLVLASFFVFSFFRLVVSLFHYVRQCSSMFVHPSHTFPLPFKNGSFMFVSPVLHWGGQIA